jgi:DNA invertase Pin-like site-specific DNA recombinase
MRLYSCCQFPTAHFWRLLAQVQLEAALIAERVKAGMTAAKARGKPCGRPATPAHLVARMEALAGTTALSIQHIHRAIQGRVSRSVIGEIVKRVRHSMS